MRVQLVIAIFLIAMGFNSQAQTAIPAANVLIDKDTSTQRAPSFAGGEKALGDFLKTNTTYPDVARNKGIQGKVYVSFTINEVGLIGNVEVVRGVHPALDAEALRVVSLMPAWSPGMKNEKPVKCTFTLPINFFIYDIKELQRIEAAKVKDAQKDFSEGMILFEQKNYSEAEAYFSKSISSVPSIDGYFNRALCKLNLQNDTGFCADIDEAAILGDLESDKIYNEQCGNYDLKYKGDRPASYYGGEVGLNAFLRMNINYPLESMDKGISGKSYVTFTINSAGTPKDFIITQSAAPDQDAESIRVLSMIQKWRPARKEGVAVSSSLTIPVNFTIR